MFEKLISALPYNPSLVHQLGFYVKRLRREESVRRTGLVFLVLAFFIQFFAVISPPQPTVANSVNDLIDNGFSSRSEAARYCRDNVRHYGDILDYYGISCSEIADAQTVELKSTDHDGQLYSMGWKQLGSTYNGKPTGETPVNIPGASQPVYWRLLHVWDSYQYSSYKALRIEATSKHGVFWILYTCGNLVHIQVPNPAPQPKKCPWNPNILESSKDCHPPFCPQDHSIYVTNPKCKACPWDNNILKSDKRCVQCPNPNYPNVIASSPRCKPVCPYNKSIDKDSPNCKPCTASVSQQDKLACIEVHKTASDTTQGWTDANNHTAQPGDIITYSLYAKNNGKATVKGFVMQENLSDVLDYATVVSLNGGKMDPATMIVVWPAQDIKPGKTEKHTIAVKVKDPIPATPTSVSDVSHFDLTMTNTYGNTINIKVPGPPIKQAELAAASLPNTGPGSSLAIAGGIVIVAGYFFARTRLLAEESVLAIRDSNSGSL